MKIVAKPVDAVAVFTAGEPPRPCKFRFYQASGERIEVEVGRIHSIERSRLAGIDALVYTCQSAVGCKEKLYQLKYIIGEYRWELYKI
ncbi:MAG: hypothetical protein UC961_08690 [Emergencia sp.]|nr:hypothetical protein [Emergencia sp.]